MFTVLQSKIGILSLVSVIAWLVTQSQAGMAASLPGTNKNYMQEVSQASKNEDVGALSVALRGVPGDIAGYKYLRVLWNLDSSQLPNLNWEFVMQTTRVRSEIAYALVPASRRQQIHPNNEDLRSFARQTLTGSRDLATQGNAIVILGLIGGEKDFNRQKPDR